MTLALLCVTAFAQTRPFEAGDPVEPRTEIDRLVFARLAQLDLPPARLCSDAVFVRRVYLDLIGMLPEPEAVRAFLEDDAPGKRAALIEELLQREEFADYFAMKWSDVLRVKAEFPINLWPNAVQAYHQWIRASIRSNLPYDRFCRELLTSSGSCFRVPPVNFYRAVQNREPEGLAAAVAQTFMGARLEHWPPERRQGLSAFFSRVGYKATSEWKEQIVLFDASTPVPSDAAFPGGRPVALDAAQDPRQVFADWLITPENPWFARCICNRLWSWLLGRGIVHEPDDIRADNPAVNPELLAHLEQELVAADYDLRQVIRSIVNSNTYQLSAVPAESLPASRREEAAAHFAFYSLRPLEAEVLIDVLCQITGTTEEYQSAIPEPFTFIPEEARAVELADGSITSPFLELFGRPARDTGLESERNAQPTVGQRLHLLNSSHVMKKIEQSRKLKRLLRRTKRPRQMANQLYLLVLSRFPTPAELKKIQAYVDSGAGSRGESGVDLVWALMNSTEFLHRH